jgi:hypothetical protein
MKNKFEYTFDQKIYDFFIEPATIMQMHGSTSKIRKIGERYEKMARKAIQMYRENQAESKIMTFIKNQQKKIDK